MSEQVKTLLRVIYKVKGIEVNTPNYSNISSTSAINLSKDSSDTIPVAEYLEDIIAKKKAEEENEEIVDRIDTTKEKYEIIREDESFEDIVVSPSEETMPEVYNNNNKAPDVPDDETPINLDYTTEDNSDTSSDLEENTDDIFNMSDDDEDDYGCDNEFENSISEQPICTLTKEQQESLVSENFTNSKEAFENSLTSEKVEPETLTPSVSDTTLEQTTKAEDSSNTDEKDLVSEFDNLFNGNDSEDINSIEDEDTLPDKQVIVHNDIEVSLASEEVHAESTTSEELSETVNSYPVSEPQISDSSIRSEDTLTENVTSNSTTEENTTSETEEEIIDDSESSKFEEPNEPDTSVLDNLLTETAEHKEEDFEDTNQITTGEPSNKSVKHGVDLKAIAAKYKLTPANDITESKNIISESTVEVNTQIDEPKTSVDDNNLFSSLDASSNTSIGDDVQPLASILNNEDKISVQDTSSSSYRNTLINEMLSYNIVVNGYEQKKKGKFDFRLSTNSSRLKDIEKDIWEEETPPKKESKKSGLFGILKRR